MSFINGSVLQDLMSNLLEVTVSSESVEKYAKEIMIIGGVSESMDSWER
jgi:hypothetical protein